jgi:hypothetical protein
MRDRLSNFQRREGHLYRHPGPGLEVLFFSSHTRQSFEIDEVHEKCHDKLLGDTDQGCHEDVAQIGPTAAVESRADLQFQSRPDLQRPKSGVGEIIVASEIRDTALIEPQGGRIWGEIEPAAATGRRRPCARYGALAYKRLRDGRRPRGKFAGAAAGRLKGYWYRIQG